MSVRNVLIMILAAVAGSAMVACQAASSTEQATLTDQKLGTVGAATVYGQYDGSIATVVVKQGGVTLCSNTLPLLTTTTTPFCDGPVGAGYVLVQPLTKTSATQPTLTYCSNLRHLVTVTRLTTPSGWPTDLAIRISTSTSNDGPYVSC